MKEVLDFIRQPWAWYVAGPMIALVMLLLLYFGKSFGVSSNLRTLCAIGGAGKFSDFFKFDWKKQIWNLLFVAGAITGGYIASNFLTNDEAIVVAPSVKTALTGYGIDMNHSELLPHELFSLEALGSLRGWVMLIIGGLLVGFGTRYAGGCTSGHAISGLSNLQVPSLIAVIGFFLGGLAMTHFILPYILTL